MFLFVSGASRSGKSEWAEDAVLRLSREGPRFYLATARVFDEEMRRRVARHRALRKGKGFITLEKTRDLSEIISEIPADATVLLECLPNWVANELFREDGKFSPETLETSEVKTKIARTAGALRRRCRNLVIVSDDIFSDGVTYDETTELYRRLLGELHVIFAAEADMAVECASGLARAAKNLAAIPLGTAAPAIL